MTVYLINRQASMRYYGIKHTFCLEDELSG